MVSILNSTSISSYGAGIAWSLRKDLGANYYRLIAEVIQYAHDGAVIMIENNWLDC